MKKFLNIQKPWKISGKTWVVFFYFKPFDWFIVNISPYIAIPFFSLSPHTCPPPLQTEPSTEKKTSL